jgi:dihydropteroate synthase
MVCAPREPHTVTLADGRALDLGARTLVMGIVNVTPDSFADGGRPVDPDRAIAAAIEMAAAGADLVDVGGESTRPGAAPLAVDEELARVVPVLEGLRGRLDVPVSIDTYKAPVAQRALELGAVIVNDISALTYDAALAGVVARRGAAVVLMHMRGRPDTMYAHATYADVAREIAAELDARVHAAGAAGIGRERILVDPGIGFAKRADQSFAALVGLPGLARLGLPILVGPSRKSFLAGGPGGPPPSGRVWATAAAVTAAVLAGAHVVRVHDVAAMTQVVRTADALRAASMHTTGPPASF